MKQPPPLSFGAPIPAILWESLQTSLHRSVRRLVKDMGTSLGIPEKAILDELFRSGDAMVRPYLFEESDPRELDCRCMHLMQKPDTPLLVQPCGQPILWTQGNSSRCPEHFGAGPPRVLSGLPILTPIQVEEGSALYAGEDGTVYDEAVCIKGHFEKGSKRLLLFHIEDD